MSKLENTRDRQAGKISALQEKIHSVDGEANRSLLSSDNAVRTLSNELRFLKSTLEQITERERRVRFISSLVDSIRLVLFLVTRFSCVDRSNARS